MISISAGGVALPSPISLREGDEIIWSADTGRTASGRMVGDVISEKRTLAIGWGVLTKAELASIRARLIAGFFPISVTVDGETWTIDAYWGTLTYELMGTYGGVSYYNNAAVEIIQR